MTWSLNIIFGAFLLAFAGFYAVPAFAAFSFFWRKSAFACSIAALNLSSYLKSSPKSSFTILFCSTSAVNFMEF
jgi:hypothetical protein